MASYCPYCGTPASEEGRFCMRCGRERPPLPDAPPTATAPGAPGSSASPDAPGTPDAPGAPDAPAAPDAPPAPPAPASPPSVPRGPSDALLKSPAAPPTPPTGPPAPVTPPASPGPAGTPAAPSGIPTPPAPPTPPNPPGPPSPPVPPAPPAGQALGAPELVASSAPPPHPAAAPPSVAGGAAFPPGHVLPPPPPSGAPSAFLRRTTRGDWGGAVQTALLPLVLLLVAAFALAAPTYGQSATDDDTVGFGDRFGIALAVVLQSVGGDVTIERNDSVDHRVRPDSLLDGGIDYEGEYVPADESHATGGGMFGEVSPGKGSFSLTPLSVLLLWLLALYAGLRALRGRLLRAPREPAPDGPWSGVPGASPWARGDTAGLEAAARVTALVTAGTLVLALFARPALHDVEASGSLLAVPGTLLLTAVVSAAVLSRDEHASWLAARPALARLATAFGTALRALAFTLALAAAVLAVVYLQADDFDESPFFGDELSGHLVALLMLLNFAVSGAAFAWGASARTETGSGVRYERDGFGLTELGDAVGGWAVAGSLAAGALCALFLGVLAARRHTRAPDRVLAGALFLGLFVTLVAFGGLGLEWSGGMGLYGGGGQSSHFGTEVSDALFFALPWVAGGLVVGALLVRLIAAPTPTPTPPPSAAPTPPPSAGGTAGPSAPAAVPPPGTEASSESGNSPDAPPPSRS
ncbi:hypothetical protein JNUCC64_20570 [Streptomyces sp. JNUCC 64]